MGRGRAIEREVSDEAIRQYLDGIGSYNLLTAEDEVRLAKAIETGRKAETIDKGTMIVRDQALTCHRLTGNQRGKSTASGGTSGHWS